MAQESLNQEASAENLNPAPEKSVERTIFDELARAKVLAIEKMQTNENLAAFKQTDYEKEKYIEEIGLDAENAKAYEIMSSMVKMIPEGLLPNQNRDELITALALGITNGKRAEDSRAKSIDSLNAAEFK